MNIKLIFKGFIVGLGKIIPGVSGAILAISMGIYEKVIKIVSNPFKNFKNNLFFLGNLGIGFVTAVILMSKIIDIALKKQYFFTMLFFVGLIIGTIPTILNEVKNYKFKLHNLLFVILAIALCYLLTLFKTNQLENLTYDKIVIIGLIDAVSMIIPGISGTAILMLLGLYNGFIALFTDINIFNLCFFALGLGIGVLITAKIMDYLFANFKVYTYYTIIGFLISSILLLLSDILNTVTIMQMLLGLIFVFLGFIISRIFNKI